MEAFFNGINKKLKMSVAVMISAVIKTIRTGRSLWMSTFPVTI